MKWPLALTLLPLMVLSAAVPAQQPNRPTAAKEPENAAEPLEFDKYRGCTAKQLQPTGFFRVAQIDSRWWLITPEGHPFFSTGINVLSFRGTPTADGKCHYQEAAQKKYASRQAWAKAQVDRCFSWGWNTVGAWSDWQLFQNRMPYTVLLNVGGHNWNSGPWSDPFADNFRQAVRKRIQEIAAPLANDPYLVGYFLANEMKWGPDHRGGHLLADFFARPLNSPGKAALIRFLQSRYSSIDKLTVDFNTKADSWQKLSASTVLSARDTISAMETQLDWAGKVAQAFFSITAEELRAVDPNHLNLGARFISQFTPRRVIAQVGKYVDVMSINFYDMRPLVSTLLSMASPDYLPTSDFLREHYEASGRPILISEWSYRAADVGLPNSWPPVYPTLATQTARADAFEKYYRHLLARPWFVGHHWFQFADQPPEGRFDGENNNFGLVNEKDQPYKNLIHRSQKLHHETYQPLTTPTSP